MKMKKKQKTDNNYKIVTNYKNKLKYRKEKHITATHNSQLLF